MVLPTLVENAIKHGLSPLPEGGRIDIRARREARTLIVEVRDNGAGFSGSAGAASGSPTRGRGWLRCTAVAPDCTLATVAPRGVIASIRLPLESSRRPRRERRSDAVNARAGVATLRVVVRAGRVGWAHLVAVVHGDAA